MTYLIPKQITMWRVLCSLFFVTLTLTVSVSAAEAKTIKRGEAATIGWSISGDPNCTGDFVGSYPNNSPGETVFNTWDGYVTPNASGTLTFPAVWGNTAAPFPQTYTFRCTSAGDSSTAVLTINDCGGTEAWNGSACIPKQPRLLVCPDPAAVTVTGVSTLDVRYWDHRATAPDCTSVGYTDVTNAATWSSANPAIATVTNIALKGQVTGVAAGSTNINVDYLTLSTSRPITVTAVASPTANLTINGSTAPGSITPADLFSMHAWGANVNECDTYVATNAAFTVGNVKIMNEDEDSVWDRSEAVGTYYYRTQCRMGAGAWSPWSSTVTLTVNPVANTLPIISAGFDASITLPITSANTSGASAIDSDGFITGILWTEVSRPGGAPATTITDATTLGPTFSNLTTAGTYRFNLRVTDNAAGVSNETMDVVVNPLAVFSCTAPFPVAFSSYHPGDDTVGANTPGSYSAVDTAVQCEYACNPAYWWTGAACVLPDLSAANTSPASAADFSATDSATAPITQGGWADLEIDTNNDGVANLNYNAFAGVQLGAFAQSGSKDLTYTLAAGTLVPGSYRYRFHVDTNGAGVVESNDGNPSNNQSPWVAFSISVPIPGSPAPVMANPGGCGGKIVVSWNSAADADHYEIRVNGGGWTNVGNVLNHTVTSLPINTPYTIDVRVVNSVGVAGAVASGATNSSPVCTILGVANCPVPIADGANTCSSTVIWDITGAVSPNIYNLTRALAVPGTAIASGTVPITLYRSSAYGNAATGDNVIQARDNVAVVQTVTAVAPCGASSFFHTTDDRCRPVPNILITPSPAYIRSGETANLTFGILANYSGVTCTFVGAMSGAAAINHAAAAARTNYTRTSDVLTSAQVIRISCTAPGLPAPVTSEVRVNVLPEIEEI
jgi:Bacterial Ig-like domain (group 2)